MYNAADIEHAKVIWAREKGDADNARLLDYYRDRRVWLIEPDRKPVGLEPYPVPNGGLLAYRKVKPPPPFPPAR